MDRWMEWMSMERWWNDAEQPVAATHLSHCTDEFWIITENTNVHATREANVLRYGSAGVCCVSDRGLRDGLLSAYWRVCVCVCVCVCGGGGFV